MRKKTSKLSMAWLCFVFLVFIDSCRLIGISYCSYKLVYRKANHSDPNQLNK